jgi:predicted RNA-binding protein with PIN domain
MSWAIDGNNVLGRIGASRHAADTKRQLVRMLAAFARVRRTKVVCFFDGHAPEHFGSHLGSVVVIFSGSRSADELIVARVATGQGWKLVTNDRGLAARVVGRRVTVHDPAAFVAELERLPRDESSVDSEQWDEYFSDPKNRNVF